MENKSYQLVNKSESIDDFGHKKLLSRVVSSQSHQFHYFKASDCKSTEAMQYRKRDFFKVSFLHGDYIIHYGNESIRASGASLSIFHPTVPYTIETIKETTDGGYFIFTDVFYDGYFKGPINQFPLFKDDLKTIYLLDQDHEDQVRAIFDKIEKQTRSTYDYRNHLILNCINELLHHTYNLHPVSERIHVLSHKERFVKIFKDLLENQFPVNAVIDAASLRNAGDFANRLNVHVNYLNRIIKEVTGKSTTQLINERYLKESLMLIKHSDWSISEISYSLGFKDPSHFNHFFKNMTNTKPTDYRK